MARSPFRLRAPASVAALLTVAALAVACSSTVGGSASPGSALPPSSAASAAPPTPPSGITAPSTLPSATASPPAAAAPPPSSGAPTDDDGSTGTVGNPGIGDPYYPLEGNGGYQVDSYDIDLSYDPAANALQSTARIKGSVISTDGLSQFDLDLQPTMKVSAVTVNDAPATFKHDEAELVITPAELLPAQSPLAVEVTYSGQPGPIPGGTAGNSDGGWYRTQSGGAFAAGEPDSASAWYPVNEHPADTATFAVTASVPQGWQVISNGIVQTNGVTDPGTGQSVFRWQLSEAVASYLTTIYIDKFTLVQDTLADGKPIISAIAPSVPGDSNIAKDTKKIIDVLSGYFGPYPFEAAGGIFVGEHIGFALETATRPLMSGGADDLDTFVHELSHQWFGDDVTIKRWSDICLNECFASYGPWLWNAEVNGEDLDATWKREMSNVVNRRAFWQSPLVDMGPGQEFTRVYDRGPLALHALRAEIGDEAFLQVLKGWPATYGGKNASFDDLETYVSTVAGRDLKPFMDAWFRGTTVPPDEFRYPGNLGG